MSLTQPLLARVCTQCVPGTVAVRVCHTCEQSRRESRGRPAEARGQSQVGDLVGSMGQVASAAGSAAMESFFSLLHKNVLVRQHCELANSCGSGSSPGSNAHPRRVIGLRDLVLWSPVSLIWKLLWSATALTYIRRASRI